MDTPLFPLALFEDDFANVYEPAEDTFLLMDVLEQDLDQLKAMRLVIFLHMSLQVTIAFTKTFNCGRSWLWIWSSDHIISESYWKQLLLFVSLALKFDKLYSS